MIVEDIKQEDVTLKVHLLNRKIGEVQIQIMDQDTKIQRFGYIVDKIEMGLKSYDSRIY